MCLCSRGGGGTWFEVSMHGINPNSAKVQGSSDLMPLKGVSGIKQILRTFNFNQRFIQNFATVAEPYVEFIKGKMKKHSKVKWD